MKKLIAVFGPGSVDSESDLYREALHLGTLLANHHFVTITGGYGGTMEAASRGARESGGATIGVTAEVYFARGIEVNPYVTKEIRVKSANDRLMELIDLADAYTAIGNSTGTLNEVLTAWDYMTKNFIPIKPIILIGEDWRPFYEYVKNGPHFVHCEYLVWVTNAQSALNQLIGQFGVQQDLPELNVVKR